MPLAMAQLVVLNLNLSPWMSTLRKSKILDLALKPSTRTRHPLLNLRGKAAKLHLPHISTFLKFRHYMRRQPLARRFRYLLSLARRFPEHTHLRSRT